MKKMILKFGIVGMLIPFYSGLIRADNILSKLEFHRTQGVEMGKLSVYFSESQQFGAPKKLKGASTHPQP